MAVFERLGNYYYIIEYYRILHNLIYLAKHQPIISNRNFLYYTYCSRV